MTIQDAAAVDKVAPKKRGTIAVIATVLVIASSIAIAVPILQVIARYIAIAVPILHQQASIRSEQSRIAEIATAVHMVYGGQVNYNGLTAELIASSNTLPSDWLVYEGVMGTAGIAGAMGSTFVLEPVSDLWTGDPYGSWAITVTNIPPISCVGLAVESDIEDEFGVAINGFGAPIQLAPEHTNPLPSMTAAITACQHENNTLTFFMR